MTYSYKYIRIINLILTLLFVSEKSDELNQFAESLESEALDAEKVNGLQEQSRLTAYFRFLFLMLLVMVAAPKAEAQEAAEFKPSFLRYLMPTHPNFAPNAKRYEEPRKGEFGEIPLVPKSQQPFLWQCDELDDNELEQTPSPVFEAAKEVQKAFHSKKAEAKTRLRQLNKLKELIDVHESAQKVSPELRQKVRRLKQIYKNNAKIIHSGSETWTALEEEATTLLRHIELQVVAERQAGARLQRCAKPQDFFDIGSRIKPTDPPKFDNFDSYSDEGVSLLPFRCEVLHPTDTTKTSSSVYIAISLLQKIITEHVLVALEREKDYIIAADRATGEVGDSPTKIQRRNALNALKSGSPLNTAILEGDAGRNLQGWLSLLEEVRTLQAKVYYAVRAQTKEARKISRCKPPSKSHPRRPSAKGTKALKKAVAENDVTALKAELRKQLLEREKISSDQINHVFIRFAEDADIRSLDRKKKAIGQAARELFSGKDLVYHILRKEMKNGTHVACIMIYEKDAGMQPKTQAKKDVEKDTNKKSAANPTETLKSPDVLHSRALVKTINDYRKQKGLPEIPMSPALNKVAQAHVKDLAENEPHDERGCNPHSWSDRAGEGASGCCYTPNHANAACMWDKPRELTKYQGNGYEIAAVGVGSPEEALALWQTSTMHHAAILNKGIWKDADWKAIGAAVHNGYAVVWFGKQAVKRADKTDGDSDKE